jgi:murein L,D-transpeptidase YcbB/YkuD
MYRTICILLAGLLIGAASPSPIHWTRPQREQLQNWISVAKNEGLELPSVDMAVARNAIARGDDVSADIATTRAAVALLSVFRNGCCNAALKYAWHITSSSEPLDTSAAIADALAKDSLNDLFSTTRPSHPHYLALTDAFARETDPSRRAIIAANLNRWRWMPRDLGQRYLLVNVAAFEASLWENGRPVGRWQVIVGRTRSPTPVFEARVSGVTLNPWWEIPPRIAAEGIARLITSNPAEAEKRGYVRDKGHYRQRPGATNALGRMKLVMPNRFNVYLHDTPAQALFQQDVRTFSHGCVRVGDALGLAATLLGRDRSAIDAMVATGRPRTLALSEPMPVYIVYFTAEPDDAGGVRYFPDVYHRDVGARAPGPDGQCPG